MKNLKRLRSLVGLTQVDLARIMGVEQSTVSMWETGSSSPRAALLPLLADTLQCSIDQLYGESQSEAVK